MYVIISCHMQYIIEHVSVYLDDGTDCCLLECQPTGGLE